MDGAQGVGDGGTGARADEQKDAADLLLRGDGAAGDDGELGRQLGNGDEAEVGFAGV